jgi:hypothetical protein
MTPIEQQVAGAALKAGKAPRYEDIHAAVSATTGVEESEVKEIVERLAMECVLWKRGGPTQNLAEGGLAGTTPVKGWYEKGDCWSK